MNRRVLIFLLAVIALLIAAFFLPVKAWLAQLLTWIDAHREIAWLSFIGAYVVACVLLLPGLILTIAAGALFGLLQGVVLVSLASVAGATAAFFIGRTFARDWARTKVQAMPRFAALDRALEQKGFLIVLLTRLSPLFPFNLLNYAYGLTGVRARDYVIASWIGMLPGTVLYVYVGSAAASLAQVASGDVSAGGGGRVLFFIGLVATVAVAVLVTRMARRTLDRELGTP
jgi:uncharacterized membrane protein YdjX (TVP38/TMEM64 family)